MPAALFYYEISCIYQPSDSYVACLTEGLYSGLRIYDLGAGPRKRKRLMTRILIADDSPYVLESIKKVIEEHPDWKICGEAADGLEAVSKAAELTPDLIVLDLTMPNLNGFQAARAIHTAAPSIPLLLYTQHLFDTHLEKEARNAGFSGAVTKGSGDSLTAAVESLLKGEQYFSNAVAVLKIAPDPLATITDRPKKPDPPDEAV
jgi:DNA-binding NarL/FixJ family response regulator